MHVAMKELRELADCCLQGGILNTGQVQKKRHIGECDSCYERFCTEYLILMAFREMGLYPHMDHSSRASISMLSLLTIRLIENQLKVSCEHAVVDGLNWEFIRMPRTAAMRGGQEPQASEYYVNRISEHSCIRREEDRVRIQLDGDVFPVEQLKVCVTTGDIREFYDFEYDAEMECHAVVLDDTMLSEDSVIEIVEVNYE